MIRASVIMPCFSKASLLPLSLAGLANQTASPKDFEVIVVDDGSTDGTAEIVGQRMRANLRYLREPNGGASAARNAAIACARGEVLIFSDPDMIPCPDFVRKHMAHHPRATRCVVIGGKKEVLAHLPWCMTRWPFAPLAIRLIRRHPWRGRRLLSLLLRTFTCRLLIEERTVCRGFAALRRLVLPFPIPEPPSDLSRLAVPWVFLLSGNFSVRAETLQQTGGFDETFRGWGLEDVELGYRLHRQGARFIYEPAAASYHQVHAFSPTRTRAALAINLRRFTAKHPCREVTLHKAFITGDISLREYDALVREAEGTESAAGKNGNANKAPNPVHQPKLPDGGRRDQPACVDHAY